MRFRGPPAEGGDEHGNVQPVEHDRHMASVRLPDVVLPLVFLDPAYNGLAARCHDIKRLPSIRDVESQVSIWVSITLGP